MTCKEKLMLEHPEFVGKQYMYGIKGCPYDYGYLDPPLYCSGVSSSCNKCWDRTILEENVCEGDTTYKDFINIVKKLITFIPKIDSICDAKEDEHKLSINDYQKAALRTESGANNTYSRILNGLMGLNGESGECIDILKKHLFQGHELDKEHLAKELGDVAWYLAVSADAIGYDLETILQMNVDKLKARYPDGFKEELSKNRKEEDI